MLRGGWTGGPLRRTTHGHAARGNVSSEYSIWQGMLLRCYDPTHPHYDNYGGRGIQVCPAWRESFQAFFDDVGPKPKRHSLDRIDNNGNYEKANVRWANAKQQARNKRSNRVITYLGETLTLIEWAERFSMIPETISMRLKSGWSVERALTKEAQSRREIEYLGRKQTMTAWAREFGKKPLSLRARLEAGWTVHEALTIPIEGNGWGARRSRTPAAGTRQ